MNLNAGFFGVGLDFGKGQGGYMTTLANKRLVFDDLKQILLTNPGERIFDPNFGVGIDRYLFEPNSTYTAQQIENVIKEQIKTYLPIVNLISVDFEFADNALFIKVKFTIPDLSGQIELLNVKRDIAT